jgi:hypothetical protein
MVLQKYVSSFVLGAVSPAVVVPSLLGLQEKGYGEDKGISTLVIAASSIDDIVAISGFGVVLGLIFSKGKNKFTFLFILWCRTYARSVRKRMNIKENVVQRIEN